MNKVPRRLADVVQARDELGFTAEVDLEEGLTRLVNWWRATRFGATPEPVAVAAPEAG